MLHATWPESIKPMRILVANDGFGDAGGVQAYLDAVIGALDARGHTLSLAYCTDDGGTRSRVEHRRFERFRVTASHQGMDDVRRWAPDVCFSHNMNDLEVDRQLARLAPVVKFMHGYFGTCVSGLKMHAFPRPVPCDRTFGPACAALYFPRRCGLLDATTLVRHSRWGVSQRSLFDRYAAVVVASGHMEREYARNGAASDVFIPIRCLPPVPCRPGHPSRLLTPTSCSSGG